MSGKNQYGRKTWDVDEYSKVAKERARGKGKSAVIDDRVDNFKKMMIGEEGLSNNDILKANIKDGQQDMLFGEENSWFVCKLCNRRFKDTLMLTTHLSSRQHVVNMKRLQEEKEGIRDSTKVITLENVKKHLYALRDRNRECGGK